MIAGNGIFVVETRLGEKRYSVQLLVQDRVCEGGRFLKPRRGTFPSAGDVVQPARPVVWTLRGGVGLLDANIGPESRTWSLRGVLRVGRGAREGCLVRTLRSSPRSEGPDVGTRVPYGPSGGASSTASPDRAFAASLGSSLSRVRARVSPTPAAKKARRRRRVGLWRTRACTGALLRAHTGGSHGRLRREVPWRARFGPGVGPR